jgi:hypothetical protein
MIENRHRVENEVLLGRQAVRKALQNKDKSREAAKAQSGLVLQPIFGTRLPPDGTDTGPVPTTSEAPMSMDTDAEDAFKKGSPWFFKRGTSKSGSSTPRYTETELKDARHSNGVASQPLIWRGSWPSSFFYTQGTDRPPTTPQPTVAESPLQPGETVPQNVTLPSSPGILGRIRRRSTLTSPFSTLRHTAARAGSRPASEYGLGDAQGTWSSDTSSEEDFPSPEWRGSRHQQLPSLVDLEDIDHAPTLSSDDEAGGDSHSSPEVPTEGAELDS